MIFSIAGINLEIVWDFPLEVLDRFKKFETRNAPDCSVIFKECVSFDQEDVYEFELGEGIHFKERFQNGQFYRAFFYSNLNNPDVLLKRKGEKVWEVLYLPSYRGEMKRIEDLFSHIAFERIMIENQAIILHASLIDVNGEGILFSGPSGIGKSTQADLWCQYEDAELINGDKVIIRNVDGVWYGYGSPFAGSSNVFKNRRIPIRTIAFLNRAVDECSCHKLSASEAFKKFYSLVTINSWNTDYVQIVLKMSEQICNDISMCKLFTRKDQSSVNCFKKYLEEN